MYDYQAEAKCFYCGAAIRDNRAVQSMVVRVPTGGTTKESFCSVSCLSELLGLSESSGDNRGDAE